jgi:hypothetical protein
MIDEAATLKVAIDLMHFPSQVRRIRSAPLLDGVFILLRIACGDEGATRHAAESVRCPPETVREAAVFFVEQILLFPDADSYRVLGARPEATNGELRCNMALLLRWLHPDLDRQGGRSVFAARVTRAWNDLKTQERRAAYDRLQRFVLAEKSLHGTYNQLKHSLAEESPLRAQGRARGQSNKQASNRRQHNGGPHSRYVGFHRSRYLYRGLLRRVLLLLFGRAAH